MLRRFPQWRLLAPLALCAVLTLAPSLAEARAGSSHSSPSSSMGSRGSRSFEQNGAQPLTRSTNPAPSAAVPSTSPSPMGAPAAAAGGSFFQRHPFLTGIAGGFLGSMLFSSMGGFGHALGGLLTVAIIGLLIFFVIRLLSSRGASSGAGGGGMPVPQSVGAAAAPTRNRFRGIDVSVGDADLTAFQGLHAAIQEAWSRGDLGRLRQLMTPEMVGYFSEELSKNASQGTQNIVTNVNLLKGDVSESWEEGDLQYATAYMRWSAIDFDARIGRSPNDADYVVSGNPRVPTEAEEVWTFVRRRGGNWILSAIQQV